MLVRVSAAALTLLSCDCRGDDAPASDPVVVRADVGTPSADAIDAAIEQLVDGAARRRAAMDFGALPPWSRRSGADPVALLADGTRTLGLEHRGRLVVVDDRGQVTSATPTLAGARALVETGDAIVVASEATGELQRFDAQTLEPQTRHRVAGVAAVRDLAWGSDEQRLYLADPHRHRIVRVAWPPPDAAPLTTEPVDTCEGALAVVRTGPWLVYDCMLAHRIVVRRVEDDGALGATATIEHDGPQWSFDARISADDTLEILVGGVEDRPLDRTDGAFGFIDSFAFVYEARAAQGPAVIRQLHALDVGAYGVITPKHVQWMPNGHAMVTGYGAATALDVSWPEDPADAPHVVEHTVVPGIVDVVGTLDAGVMANPLLDAWMSTRPGSPVQLTAVADPSDDRTASERLGEALVFTGLLAPQASSDGRRSRFSCETCHFEGRTDGRVHWTGRGKVHATTKTLRGLFNNRPHFSRALDETTARMVHNEFRVANAGTDQDPWFSVSHDDVSWLDALGAPPDPLGPVALRQAVIDFLAAFTPEPNPAIEARTEPTALQIDGAKSFANHCVSCHQARLVADDPGSLVATDRWFAHIFSPSGGIVWGTETRVQTGVEPYVHEDGARVPSLRRLWVKRPLLTNGSAATVEQVLDAFRPGTSAVHGGGPGTPLPPDEREALAAFVDLL